MATEMNIFLKACESVDHIRRAKRSLTTMPVASASTRRCLQEWMDAHKSHYGNDHLKPKSHWAFDVCDHLESDPMVIDAFVIERLHLRVKAEAEFIKRLENYESSVLARVVNAQVESSQKEAGCGLIGRTAPLPGAPDAIVADRMEVFGAHFSVGDFIARGDQIAQVQACADENGELFVIADAWHKEASDDVRQSWRSAGARCVWPASELHEVISWKLLANGCVIVIDC